MAEEVSSVDEALDRAASREAIMMGACLDARQTASVVSTFYRKLREDEVDENPATQLSIIYARRILNHHT